MALFRLRGGGVGYMWRCGTNLARVTKRGRHDTLGSFSLAGARGVVYVEVWNESCTCNKRARHHTLGSFSMAGVAGARGWGRCRGVRGAEAWDESCTRDTVKYWEISHGNIRSIIQIMIKMNIWDRSQNAPKMRKDYKHNPLNMNLKGVI